MTSLVNMLFGDMKKGPVNNVSRNRRMEEDKETEFTDNHIQDVNKKTQAVKASLHKPATHSNSKSSYKKPAIKEEKSLKPIINKSTIPKIIREQKPAKQQKLDTKEERLCNKLKNFKSFEDILEEVQKNKEYLNLFKQKEEEKVVHKERAQITKGNYKPVSSQEVKKLAKIDELNKYKEIEELSMLGRKHKQPKKAELEIKAVDISKKWHAENYFQNKNRNLHSSSSTKQPEYPKETINKINKAREEIKSKQVIIPSMTKDTKQVAIMDKINKLKVNSNIINNNKPFVKNHKPMMQVKPPSKSIKPSRSDNINYSPTNAIPASGLFSRKDFDDDFIDDTGEDDYHRVDKYMKQISSRLRRGAAYGYDDGSDYDIRESGFHQIEDEERYTEMVGEREDEIEEIREKELERRKNQKNKR